METVRVKMMVAKRGTGEWCETDVPVQATEHASAEEIKRKACQEAEKNGFDIHPNGGFEIIRPRICTPLA